jgi:Mg2+ and Co2+ transporter CorA
VKRYDLKVGDRKNTLVIKEITYEEKERISRSGNLHKYFQRQLVCVCDCGNEEKYSIISYNSLKYNGCLKCKTIVARKNTKLTYHLIMICLADGYDIKDIAKLIRKEVKDVEDAILEMKRSGVDKIIHKELMNSNGVYAKRIRENGCNGQNMQLLKVMGG